ncbi:hypothetical protein A2U01_0027958, partial [Trifolium medium]|nr:hypothetical protein [Trifolium medium]
SAAPASAAESASAAAPASAAKDMICFIVMAASRLCLNKFVALL